MPAVEKEYKLQKDMKYVFAVPEHTTGDRVVTEVEVTTDDTGRVTTSDSLIQRAIEDNLQVAGTVVEPAQKATPSDADDKPKSKGKE